MAGHTVQCALCLKRRKPNLGEEDDKERNGEVKCMLDSSLGAVQAGSSA